MQRIGVLFTVCLCFGIATYGCDVAPTSSDSQLNNIYGIDDREVADTTTAPYRSLGRLDTGCTAFLIGAKLVMTAAHCVVDSAGTLKRGLSQFGMDFKDGVAQVKANVKAAWIGSFNPEDARDRDWAILEIDQNLGAERGTLKLKSVDFAAASFPMTATVVGYQSDFAEGNQPAKATGCSMVKYADARVLFDCDTFAGVSGGPMMFGSNDSTEVVALAVSEYRNGSNSSVRRDQYSDEYANVGISLTAAIKVADRLLSTVDQGGERPTIADAFYLEVDSATRPGNDTAKISLYVSRDFSGGVFTDNTGQIKCRGLNSDCQGIYSVGAQVQLVAPATLYVNNRTVTYRGWECFGASEPTSNRTNVCQTTGLTCTVTVVKDMTCGAWYN